MSTEQPPAAPAAARSRSLRSRIRSGVAILLLPLVVVIAMAEFALIEERNSVRRVTTKAVREVLPLADLAAEVESAERLGIDAASGDVSVGDSEAYDAIVVEVDQHFAALALSGLTAERNDLGIAAAAWRRATRALDTALATMPLVKNADDPSLLPFTSPLRTSVGALDRAIEASRVDLAAEIAAADRRRRLVSIALIVIAVASVGIVFLVRRRLTKSISVPISALQEGSRRFGRGDLEHKIVPHRDDELGELAEALNGMAAKLAAKRDALAESRQRLIQAQKMEAVGQLAGGIAHDFNNLLLVVGSYADFLHDSFEEDDPRRNDAAEIRQASDRGAALTRQLLTFSRRDVAQPVPLDLAAAIVRLEEMLRRTLPATIDLQLDLDHDLDPTVIDAGQLEQVVLNLVLNAENAMPDGGTLTIRLRDAAEETPLATRLVLGSSVAIAFSDTGVGMSDDVRSRALEPFFTTRADEGGSGLGLATVYGIVTGAGGAMTIESEPGEGTTVVLYLPTTAADVAGLAPAEPVRGLERGDQTVILVADDEPTILALTTRILSAQGYTVLAAASGVAALELARETEHVDALLTDVMMPGMTGSELAATLAQERPGLPIVYMSGYSDQIVAEEGVLDPDALYLGKPFKPQELLELVRTALAVPV